MSNARDILAVAGGVAVGYLLNVGVQRGKLPPAVNWLNYVGLTAMVVLGLFLLYYKVRRRAVPDNPVAAFAFLIGCSLGAKLSL